MTASPSAVRARSLPAGIWAIGFVSLFMDMSSEMIHALLPSYLVGSLGVSMFALGLLEGGAEATASLTKVVSGSLSDRWRRRKPLVVLGYGLAALTKPLFPMAHHASLAVIARLVDRVGKGIRGAPRDALVADITPPEQQGAAYGLRQSMDTAGAFVGPLAATGLMVLASIDVRTVLWIAVAPAFVAVLVLIAFVREPEGDAPASGDAHGATDGGERDAHGTTAHARGVAAWRRFPLRFWGLVLLVTLFTLMRFSEAFLVLRAREVGTTTAYLPITLVAMSGTYMLTAYPAGYLADRTSRHTLLAIGCVVMIAADACLGRGGAAFFAAGPAITTWLGILLWGVHMGLTEGIVSALTAAYAPADLRGTAFGIVNLARGITVLVASGVAGARWSRYGSAMTFGAGAVMAAITAVLALAQGRAHAHATNSTHA